MSSSKKIFRPTIIGGRRTVRKDLVKAKMTLTDLSQEYFISNDYSILAHKTKQDYEYYIRVLLGTKVEGKCLAQMNMIYMTGAKARKAYETWLQRGVVMANHICAVSRKMYSFGMEMGYAETNPFATFKRKQVKPRNVVWSRDQIKKYLDFCYSDFQYRNLGLISQMAYEWCQRVGDMRMLEFSSIDFDKKVLNLEQSKRGATVHLPIEDELFDMLVQQKEDFGFQDYVAPYFKPRNGVYSPYQLNRLSRHAREAITLAGLPNTLRIADLRRTGTTEMVEAGVSMGQIMSVTGHANPSSVKPYMKNTYTSGETALPARSNHVKST